MAPEQLSGEGVDGRSDLFSLGVILYAMVTGHSPFQGDSATTVCFKVANREPVAASALDLNLPRELDEVISRAMAKDRRSNATSAAQSSPRTCASCSSCSTPARRPHPCGRSRPWRLPRRERALAPDRQPLPERIMWRQVAKADKAVRTAIRKAPIRDLILGVTTLIVLVFVAGSNPDYKLRHSKGGECVDVAPPAVGSGGPSSAKDAAGAATVAVPATPAPRQRLAAQESVQRRTPPIKSSCPFPISISRCSISSKMPLFSFGSMTS